MYTETLVKETTKSKVNKAGKEIIVVNFKEFKEIHNNTYPKRNIYLITGLDDLFLEFRVFKKVYICKYF